MSGHVGFVVDRVAQGFLKVLWFPLSSIPLTAPYALSSVLSRAGTVCQIVTNTAGGLSLTPPQKLTKTLCVFVSFLIS
jgi:hypothetical protein